MTVKNQLKLAGVTASSKFYRKGILRDPVERNMCYYIRTACLRYKKRLATKREVILQPKSNHEEKYKNQRNKKEKQSARKGNC